MIGAALLPLLPLRVRDVPDHYLLLCDSQDLRAVLDSIGCAEREDGAGCLFVDCADGEYRDVLLCAWAVPCLNYPLERLAVTS